MADLGLPPYQHWITSVAQLSNEQIDVVNVADGARLPATIDATGVIGGGSIHAAFEDHSWIHHTKDFLRAAQRQGIPELHFCWSHQVKALTEGGEVAPGRQGRRIGVERLFLTPAGQRDPLFAGMPGEFDIFTSHTDVVTKLPANGHTSPIELARGSVYPYEALAYGPTVRTLQVHPELTADPIITLTRERREQLIQEKVLGPSPEEFEAHIDQLRMQNDKIRRNSLRIVENWIQHFVGPAFIGRDYGPVYTSGAAAKNSPATHAKNTSAC